MKTCTCLKSPCMPIQWTATIVFYNYLEDKRFGLVVREGLVENEVGAFLFPLFLPLCVHVCERELLWWTKGKKNSDFSPQNCNLMSPDTAYFLKYTYICIYIYMKYIYACSHSHARTQSCFGKKGYVTRHCVKWQSSKATELIFVNGSAGDITWLCFQFKQSNLGRTGWIRKRLLNC